MCSLLDMMPAMMRWTDRVTFTTGTTWTERLPRDPTRVAVMLGSPSIQSLWWHWSNEAIAGGTKYFLLGNTATTPNGFSWTYRAYGDLIQRAFWSRSAAGSADVILLVANVPLDYMNALQEEARRLLDEAISRRGGRI